jgi:hypothetical protein
MDEYEYSEEMRTISKFKKVNHHGHLREGSHYRKKDFGPNVMNSNTSTASKSCQLLKLLLANAKKISKAVKDQQENLTVVVSNLELEIEKSQTDFINQINNFLTEYVKLREGIKKNKFRNEEENIQNFLSLFYKPRSGSVNSLNSPENTNLIQKNKTNKNELDPYEVLNMISSNNEYKSIGNLIKFCNQNLEQLEDLKLNLSQKINEEKILLGKKRNSGRGNNSQLNSAKSKNTNPNVELSESDESASVEETFNFTPLMKLFQAYFNKHKPTSSILIPHRKRIFVNYYLDDNKRTTKSFNIAHLRNLDEFKNLLEEVKYFIRTHKVTKD